MYDLLGINKRLIKENSLLEQQNRELQQALSQCRRELESVRLSEKKFRAIADYTPGWENWIGPDGKLMWLNPMVLDFLGYTVDECLVMDDYPLAVIDDEHREKMRKLFKSALRGSRGSHVECRIRCKNGRKKWVDVTWQPMVGEEGVCLGPRSSIQDITDRKAMEEELIRAKERLEAMISALPDLLFRVDRDGCIHECHSSDKNLFYLPPSVFLGMNIKEVLPPEAASVIMEALEQAAVKGIHHGAVYCLPMTKGICWYELSIARMGLKKEPAHQFIILVRDITDRKQAEEELLKTKIKLEARVAERTGALAQAVRHLMENEQLLAEESQRLQEANTALKVLLQHRDDHLQDMEEKVLANVRQLVIPYLEKLSCTMLTPTQAGYVEVITSSLHSILSPFLKNLTSSYMDFTPREIEIANLSREGKSAKDIAQLLNSSIRSVEFHKDNIRRKLGLTHTKTNLKTYLQSMKSTSYQ